MKFYLPTFSGPHSPADESGHTIELTFNQMQREALVALIHSGKFDRDGEPETILEIDGALGTVRNVTADIAAEVGDLSFADRCEPYPQLRDWLNKHRADFYQHEDDPQDRAYDKRRERMMAGV